MAGAHRMEENVSTVFLSTYALAKCKEGLAFIIHILYLLMSPQTTWQLLITWHDVSNSWFHQEMRPLGKAASEQQKTRGSYMICQLLHQGVHMYFKRL